MSHKAWIYTEGKTAGEFIVGVNVMYNNLFFDCDHMLTEEEIIEFEKEFQFVMPDMIKKHYLSFNGGYPEKSVYDASNGERYVMNYFYAVNGAEGNDLNETLRILKDENVFPQWLIPLADDEGGNIFCYSLNSVDKGAIYYYDHEFGYGTNPERHICKISDSIVDFITEMSEEE